MPSVSRHTISLPNEVIPVIDAASAELGVSRAEIMRRAVLDFVRTRRSGSYSLSRMAEVVEYTQILLQQHVVGDDADKHNDIVAVLDKNLVEHHGR